MNKRKIGGWALIAVGGFFLFGVISLTIQDQFVDFGDPSLHIAGAIQTTSGQIMAILSILAIVGGIKLRRSKTKAVIPSNDRDSA